MKLDKWIPSHLLINALVFQSIAAFSTKVPLLHIPCNTNKMFFFSIMLFIFYSGKELAPTLFYGFWWWWFLAMMMMDKLKHNPDKTEFLILGTRQQPEKVNLTAYCWWISDKSFNTSTKLGIMVWLNLYMLSLVRSICSSSCYYIYNIRRIRKVCLIKPPYPFSVRLLPLNWTTTTAHYTAFLLFTLIKFKEFKMLLPDL